MRKKLKSQNGASMLIALVFFFLCVTVGIIVLTAAASNTGQLTHVKDQRQAYLATSSAARLIREEMEQVSFVRTETFDTVDGEIVYHDPRFVYTYPDGPLGETLVDFCRAYNWDGKRGSTISEKTITLQAEGLPDVTATFSADADLNFTIRLHTVGEDVPDHPLTLNSQSSRTQKQETTGGDDSSTTTVTTTITWPRATGAIGKGAAA